MPDRAAFSPATRELRLLTASDAPLPQARLAATGRLRCEVAQCSRELAPGAPLRCTVDKSCASLTRPRFRRPPPLAEQALPQVPLLPRCPGCASCPAGPLGLSQPAALSMGLPALASADSARRTRTYRPEDSHLRCGHEEVQRGRVPPLRPPCQVRRRVSGTGRQALAQSAFDTFSELSADASQFREGERRQRGS